MGKNTHRRADFMFQKALCVRDFFRMIWKFKQKTKRNKKIRAQAADSR